MELTLGSHVREHGRRVGGLAGFELEPATRCIRRIIFSRAGDLGPQAMTRPLALVTVAPDGINLRDEVVAPLPAVPDVVLLSRSTRVVRGGDAGRLVAIEVDPVDRRLLSVSARRHWWSGRWSLAGVDIDTSTPGELRGGSHPHGTRAA
jgi:hypothetical protein